MTDHNPADLIYLGLFLVSGSAVVGIVLSALLVVVLSVLTLLSAIRKLRRAKSAELRSPPADIECAILEKGFVHGPPTEKRRVQKQARSLTSAAPTKGSTSPSGSATDQYGMGNEENTDAEYAMDEDDDEDTITDEKENKPVSFGTLHFTVRYNFEKNALTVIILRCENLMSRTGSRKRYR